MKKFLSVIFLLLSPTICLAADDPTINGLANAVECRYSVQTYCSGDFCLQTGIPLSNTAGVLISFKTLQITKAYMTSPSTKIELLEVSPQGLNMPMYNRFQYKEVSGETMTAVVWFLPSQSGRNQGYDIHFGGVIKKAMQIGSIHFDRLMINGECQLR
jgi:hypothetical protein